MIMRVDRPSQSRRSPAPGFTMVEMMITVVILAVLLALAVPSMREMIARKRVEGVANEIATDLRYLRSIQIQRGGQIAKRMSIRFSPSDAPICYVLYERNMSIGFGICDCTSQPVCPQVTNASTELKTVRLPVSDGLRVTVNSQELNLEGTDGLPVAGATLSISVSSALGGELRVLTNQVARPSICSTPGTRGSIPACPTGS
jgi:prepilin-type N-terminal cleavage/methylation domain-containing protein